MFFFKKHQQQQALTVIIQGLFTWRLGTFGRWGNPPVCMIPHFRFDLFYMIDGVTVREIIVSRITLPNWVLLPPCKLALSVHIPLRDKRLLSYTRLLARSALKTNPKTMGDWAFMIAAPMLWSSIPLNIRQAATFTCLYCDNNNYYSKYSIKPPLPSPNFSSFINDRLY